MFAGPDWKAENQDGRGPGTVIRCKESDEKVKVILFAVRLFTLIPSSLFVRSFICLFTHIPSSLFVHSFIRLFTLIPSSLFVHSFIRLV